MGYGNFEETSKVSKPEIIMPQVQVGSGQKRQTPFTEAHFHRGAPPPLPKGGLRGPSRAEIVLRLLVNSMLHIVKLGDSIKHFLTCWQRTKVAS